MKDQRVLSGMRPTGKLHLGHYHGALKNWLELQNEYDSYYFVADWHAFTTHYSDKIDLESYTIDMVIDWLASGINPNTSTIFVQSKVPEHAELHLLLSMTTPVSWLERVPSYKDQQEKLNTKNLATYGFLGYPVLQSSDILMYKAGFVPVGEDQAAHVELTREIARRFNYIYGREVDFEEKAEIAASKMGKKQAKIYRNLRKSYQEKGDDGALVKAKALLSEQKNIIHGDRERLLGYIEGVGKIILVEPEALLTKNSKMPGLDGQKMSKSYNNGIFLRDSASEVKQKVNKMVTDPARVHLTDPGNPNKCPVWNLHEIYGKQDQLDWVMDGCTKAKMGCIECKKPVVDSIVAELKPIQESIEKYKSEPNLIQEIIFDGSERARRVAKETMQEVRDAMGLTY